MIRSERTFKSDLAWWMVVSGASRPNGSRRLSSTRVTVLCFASEQRKLDSSCSASVSLKKEERELARCLEQKRCSRKGPTTAVLNLKCLRVERGPVTVGCGLNDEGPLSRNEVVELLSKAVDTLLKPATQNRLRERLEKCKQTQSKSLEQPTNGDRWSSLKPTDSLQNLGEITVSDIGSNAFDSGRCSSDQVSAMSKNVTFPITLETTEIVQFDRQPQIMDAMESSTARTLETTELAEFQGQHHSVEAMESPTESVEGKEDKSLTSIRKLKVLDVHSYVHNALRESALRSWLRSRTISE